MTSPIDPITFEVIQNGLSSIADEMALVIMRSAYSPVVRDSMDYSTALCDANGEVVAQGLTLAVQLGSFPDIMSLIVREHGPTIMPGDVFIANDPYGSGGQHLPDIYIIKPLFVGSTLAGYATTMAHHSDVGGIAPGSVAIHARDIHQEGLRLPILKLYEAGEANDTLFNIIERNTRSPIQVLGDLRAQISSCQAGERGLAELVEKHGLDTLNVYFRALHDFAEKRMREEITAMPDGVYNNLDHIDGVGDDPEQLDIAVRLEIKGSDISIDFEGTSPQVAAAINCPIPMVHSAAYCAIRCLAQGDIPNCEGYMRPISISAPEGTILNPLEPAACAARGVMGYRVFDAVMGALAQAMPESVIAGCEGGPILFSVGGSHEGRSFVLTEVMVGTWGARFGLDGEEGVSNPAANLSNQPIELIEAELPLRILRYGLVPDSGGPGEYRGGLAFVREFEFLSDTAQFTVRSDRRRCPPYGVAGGETGSPSRNELIGSDGNAQMIPTMPMQSFDQNSGDIVRTVSAGGGGFGKALQRSPMLVLEDVLDGKVTLEGARRDYGVVINQNEVDAKATLDLRSEMESLLQ
jgi:N-methylhydantoinase B